MVESSAQLRLDTLGWRSFLFAFLTPIGAFFFWGIPLVPLTLAGLNAWYSYKVYRFARDNELRMTRWARIGTFLSPWLVAWTLAGSIAELV